jgi:hypothetical protein
MGGCGVCKKMCDFWVVLQRTAFSVLRTRLRLRLCRGKQIAQINISPQALFTLTLVIGYSILDIFLSSVSPSPADKSCLCGLENRALRGREKIFAEISNSYSATNYELPTGWPISESFILLHWRKDVSIGQWKGHLHNRKGWKREYKRIRKDS